MTFKEFLQKVYDATAKDSWLPESFLDPATHSRKPTSSYDSGLTFSVTWTMGGTHGSYDGEPTPVSPEVEPEFTTLDTILEVVAPDISFIKYKSLCNDIMVRKEVHHGDYYGGSTTEGHKGFKVKDLYNALVKRGLIEGEN